MGSWSVGNLCKGPSAALHPSSQVTKFTSLIIGSNREVIGIECCHRINVSQLHINVSALLYHMCSRKTVASKWYLSGIGKPSSTACPADSLSQGRPRARAPHTPHLCLQLEQDTGGEAQAPRPIQWTVVSTQVPHCVTLVCHLQLEAFCPLMASHHLMQRRTGLTLAQPSWRCHSHGLKSQGVAAPKSPQVALKTRGHSASPKLKS